MKYFIVFFIFIPFGTKAQLNCNAFLYQNDTLQYQACKLIEDIEKKYYQFSREYQETLDQAIAICPYFAYAYREKAAPYVKSGDFLTWKKLIDKAVKYAPIEYLNVRASLRYKFFADYSGAIKDIDLLESMSKYDIGLSSNGTYHLNIVKALCYKELRKSKEAIAIIEDQLKKELHFIGAYDYIHLGVLYLQTGSYLRAIEAFSQQEKVNNLAENQYYLALVYKKLNQREKYLNHLKEANNLFHKGYKMKDPYNHLIDEIYLKNIQDEMKTAYEITLITK